jgi:hypothetical protein
MNFRTTTRRSPDALMEELVAALLGSEAFEFKALFLVIYAALQARNAATGGEEMLRLRAYDKLQTLVRQGCATKEGKQYQGVHKNLLAFSETLKEMRAGKTQASSEKPARARPKKS